MVLDFPTAYIINLLILASFFVANLVLVRRSPTDTYFILWVGALGLWVVNLGLIVLGRDELIFHWIVSILAAGSHSLVLASAYRLVKKTGAVSKAPIALFVFGIFAASWALATRQPFVGRTLVSGALAPLAYSLSGFIIINKTMTGMAHRSPTDKAGILIAISSFLCGLAWAVRLVAFLLEGDNPSTSFFDATVPNVISAALIPPITVLLNSFYVLRVIRTQVENRREVESHILIDQNELLRNQLDSELSSRVLFELVRAEESFERCVTAVDKPDPEEVSELESRIARCTENVQLRNEMLRESVDHEELIDLDPFLERVNQFLALSGLPRFRFETRGLSPNLTLSKSYFFWICYVVGTFSDSADIRVTASQGYKTNELDLRFRLTRSGDSVPLPNLTSGEIGKLMEESRDTSLERLFVLASFVHSHFGGRITTGENTETDPRPETVIDVTFVPSLAQNTVSTSPAYRKP